MAQQPSAEVARYVPRLETLKDAGSELEVQTWSHPFGVDLLEREPSEQRRLAAVVLVARAGSRLSRELVLELPPEQVAALPTRVPEPEEWTGGVSMALLARVDTAPQVCAGCGGRNSACTVCGGGGVTIRTRVLEVRDEVETLRYAYVPSLPFSIEERITRLLEPVAEPPECLRSDMAPRRAGSAYRDVLEVEPEFYGHEFGDALPQARTAAQGFGAAAQRRDIRAYAWPVLLVRWQGLGLDHTIALVVRPTDLAHVAIVG